MNRLVIDTNKSQFFFLWKPSKIFWILILFTFFIWIYIGPIWWRHIDDFGPIQLYLSGEEPLFSKYRFFRGWGTYPPIWSLWSFISISFKSFGISQTRYILLIQGFLSTTLSGYLTVCVCLNLLIKFKNNSKLKFDFCRRIIEFLSITFNCLNPEVMLHASTYMPYNLPSITTLFLLLSLIPLDREIIEDIGENKFIFKLPLNYFILFTFLSILLSFQSIILITSFVLTYLLFKKSTIKNFSRINLKILNFKKSLHVGNLKLIFKKNFIFINFCIVFLLLATSYFIKFFNLLKNDTKPGMWAKGFGGIYDLSYNNNHFNELPAKIINNIISIIGQSIYPFRYLQEQSSILISLLILLSLFLAYRISKSGKILVINLIITFILSIFLALNGKFILSPTRHTIFLYPYIWILLIIFSLVLFEKIKNNIFNITDKIIINFLMFVFIFQSIGLINSHSLINYNKKLTKDLLRISSNADYHIIRFNNSVFISHGSDEYKIKEKNICPNKEIKTFKLFIYNHRDPLILDRKDKDILVRNSKGCITKEDEIKIINSLEKINKLDIEQNNKIFNGGSSLYGYILEINRL
tara:strand:- start:242 stop:1984 length:1743 start_codon:yes stop_codon:yes gene_type:complete